ncbi:MAG: RNA polymerase sporulation sigma factor SigG [Clostridiales bacterium]|nr:RNA polymerase sporulation sigma factor SigG [Clostridiales bacterium]
MKSTVEITGVDTSYLPKLSASEQLVLMERLKAGDAEARDQFAICNMRLVLSVVQRFRSRITSADDVFQVGCVGLMKAIDNFDMSQNVKFSTYAVPMILGEIRRYLRDNNSIRVSRSMRDTAYKVLKAREELSRNMVNEPSSADIAQYLDLPIRDVAVAMEAISDPISLCEAVYDDGEDTIALMDQLSDDSSSEEKWLENMTLRESLRHLDPRQKEILMLRYYHGRTQVEVSEDIGISQAQVSRLEKTAIDAIKKNFT